MKLRNYFLALLFLPLFAFGQISGGSAYDPTAVSITGGTIDGATIGASTPAAITATSVSTSGALTGGTTTVGTITSSGNVNVGNADTPLWRESTGILALGNNATPRAFHVYNKFTDLLNMESGLFDWTTTANVLTIGTQKAGASFFTRPMNIRIGGTLYWQFDTSGNLVPQINGGNSIGSATNFLDQVYVGTVRNTSPVTTAGPNYTAASTDTYIICNSVSSQVTITLPSASSQPGKSMTIKTTAAFAAASASANVVPLAGGSATTAILAATAGKWATIVSNGTNWVIMAAN